MNRIFHLIFKGLQCYKHDYCLNKCPELSESIVECKKEETHCWKMTSPLGTLRGCGNHRCEVQINLGVLNTANVCCSGDLCNSSIQIKLSTISIVFMSFIAFIYTWCFQ
ncbi:unnamed protein product [Rotaria sp. Silwood1]|nr:unnamed protein product [Rotaria sp. Silwood1]CAF1584158.1 unnamed protein product [Rotaria sp. Silwood1]CAF3587248.1 unnamed protein product [Rotaria sp. Silwood1]CAF3661788.1 unnamed protein product [Rotaria sp. Silwood1]CAF3676715.1 unnamed protein product [Rotaria sp. Silwood1]